MKSSQMIEQEGIKIEIRDVDSIPPIRVLNVSGYVDQANCHLLQQTIDKCLKEEFYCLAFNLQNLVYMSSAGWGVLIGEIKRFRESGGDIKLANMGPEIYEIYQMLEFYHIISEYPSVEGAMESFKSMKSSGSERTAKPKREELPPLPPEPPSETVQEIDLSIDDADFTELLGAPPASGGESLQPEREDVVLEQDVDINLDSLLSDNPGTSERVPANDSSYVEFNPRRSSARKSNLAMMPLPDKVRDIVSHSPHLSPRQIRKTLRLPDYGEVKIGYFKMRSLLKSLDLDSKEKRFRYYRSA